MKATQITVVNKNEFSRNAAEYINRSAMEAGYATAFNQIELKNCINFIQNEINSCDKYIASLLSYTVEEVEFEDED